MERRKKKRRPQKKQNKCTEKRIPRRRDSFFAKLTVQKLRILLLDKRFQRIFIDHGKRNAFSGNAETCSIHGDADGLFKFIAFLEINSQSGDERVTGSGVVHRDKAAGDIKVFFRFPGLQGASVFTHGNNDDGNAGIVLRRKTGFANHAPRCYNTYNWVK